MLDKPVETIFTSGMAGACAYTEEGSWDGREVPFGGSTVAVVVEVELIVVALPTTLATVPTPPGRTAPPGMGMGGRFGVGTAEGGAGMPFGTVCGCGIGGGVGNAVDVPAGYMLFVGGGGGMVLVPRGTGCVIPPYGVGIGGCCWCGDG